MRRLAVILSAAILAVSIADVSLHIWFTSAPLSFGFNGWRGIADNQIDSQTLVVVAVISFFGSLLWQKVVERITWSRWSWTKKKHFRFLALSSLWVMSFIAFWSLRTSIVSGDGYYLQGSMDTPGYVQLKYPIIFPVIFFIYHTIGSYLSLSAMESLRLSSVLAGATTVLLLVGIVRNLFRANLRKQLLFAFLFPSAYGLYQLWFGYTEVYALVALGWALVILVYLLVLDQKIRLVWASILSAIVYLFYIGNLLILPPYILLMVVCIWRQPHGRDRFSQVILNLVVFCVTLTLCLYLVQGINVVQLWDSNRLELQARGNPSNSIFYNIEGLLSQQHLGDFTNEWILIDATGLMLTIISPALWFLFRQSGQFNVNARVWLLGTIAVSYVAYSFIMTPILGYPKDWDLFSYIALFTALFGFYMYLSSQDQMPGSRLVYGGLAMSGWVHLVATLLPLLAASGALDSQEMAQWIVEKSSANHVFLAPLLSEDAMITSVVRSEKYRSFESRNTVVLPSRSGGMDAVYIFPGEQEKKMQKLAERLGALGALEKGAWRSGSALLYRVPVQNLPDSLDPWITLSKGGAFLQPQSKQIAIWENGIQMLGHSIEIGDSQGRNVIVRLYLRTLRKQNTNYTFSIKVRDSLGNVAGQDDKWTGNNSYGTQQWDIGDIVIEEFYPGLDTCLPGGKYTTTLEIYNAETMQIATLEGSTENLSVLESPGAMPLWACASP